MKCNNPDTNCYLTLLTILSILYIILFYVLDNFPKTLQPYVDKIQYTCLVRCDTCNLSNYRDNGYYLNSTGPSVNTCLCTLFEVSHFILHAFLGYYYNIYISLGLSVGFEIFEHYVYDCGSYLDILYNLAGFAFGYTLRHK